MSGENTLPLLSILTFLPLVGAVMMAILINKSKDKNDDLQADQNAKYFGLWVSLVTFAVSIIVFLRFNEADSSFQFQEKFEWIKDSGIYYNLGIDGISIYLILLTTLLVPICILSSWHNVKTRVKEYIMLFLILETLVIGVFTSLDLFLFYFFFEASLIPMFFIIGIWGGENKIYASYKFFLYTLLGSVFLLLAIIFLYLTFGTSNIPELMQRSNAIAPDIQKILWLAFFASFAVKVPMWPFHTWLPDAHVQAPTAGSVILAGVLLKLGAYGFIRLSLPILPQASNDFAIYVYVLSGIAVVYTSLVALVQEDMKKMIAYSSIAHMGYVTAGIFALNQQGIDGAIFQMLSHGIVSAALFLCVGVLYDRMKTKKIDAYGGVVDAMPRFALVFLIYTMASVGLPGTSGFVGEFTILLGVFKDNSIAAFIVATGIVLGATYMLLLYRKVMYGSAENKKILDLPDLNNVEKISLYILAALAVIYGVLPWLVTDVTSASVQNLIKLI
jgi:NADH-quinone oxidoreductase subunit M